jgi:hypothetical protein
VSGLKLATETLNDFLKTNASGPKIEKEKNLYEELATQCARALRNLSVNCFYFFFIYLNFFIIMNVYHFINMII